MLQALGLGLCTALLWGGSVIFSAPASREAGPWSALLWGSLVAIAIATLAAVPTGPPSGDASDWAFVGLAGLAYTAGVALWMVAVRRADISLLTPIVAIDGGIAALLALATGSSLPIPVMLALGVMVGGVTMIAAAGNNPSSGPTVATMVRRSHPQSIGLGLAIACAFGLVLFASGQTTGMSPIWVVALSRSITCLFALALYLRGADRRPSGATWRSVVLFGLLDALGFLTLVTAAHVNLPVAAVAASQYAAVAAIGGVLFLGERLTVGQLLGVVLVLCAAAVVAALA